MQIRSSLTLIVGLLAVGCVAPMDSADEEKGVWVGKSDIEGLWRLDAVGGYCLLDFSDPRHESFGQSYHMDLRCRPHAEVDGGLASSSDAWLDETATVVMAAGSKELRQCQGTSVVHCPDSLASYIDNVATDDELAFSKLNVSWASSGSFVRLYQADSRVRETHEMLAGDAYGSDHYRIALESILDNDQTKCTLKLWRSRDWNNALDGQVECTDGTSRNLTKVTGTDDTGLWGDGEIVLYSDYYRSVEIWVGTVIEEGVLSIDWVKLQIDEGPAFTSALESSL